MNERQEQPSSWLLRSTLALLVVCGASAAYAQTPASTPDNSQPPQPAFWELIGGFEGATPGTGYGFFGPSYLRPINDSMSFTARVFASHLYYEFNNGVGLTQVRSPGVNAAAGVRFGTHNFATIMGGPSFRFRRTEENVGTINDVDDTDTVMGFNVGGDMYLNPTSHSNIHGIVDYGSADEYIWSRLAYKEQLTNRSYSGRFSHFVGAEVMGQGNNDIRSVQFGGLFELAHAPSTTSIMFRAGVKRSTFEFSDPEVGPYFGIGFYRRMR